MPLAPDYLLNMFSDAPGLVDDSPQFREGEQDRQRKNLDSVTKETMRLVNQEMKETEKQMRIADEQLEFQNQQMVDSMTPHESPIGDMPEFSEEEDEPIRSVPSMSEFNIEPDPSAIPAPPPPGPNGEEDQAAIVQHIARTLGLTPQQVAAMAMLGQDIRSSQEQELAQRQVMDRQQASMPPPLTGPEMGPPPIPPQGPPAQPGMLPPQGPPGLPPQGPPPAAPMPSPLLPPQ